MALFGAFDISQSGLKVYRTWMDTIADNLPNEPMHGRLAKAGMPRGFQPASALARAAAE